jgi:hypothetical protein
MERFDRRRVVLQVAGLLALFEALVLVGGA